jgi:hypothetical protein
MPPADVATLLPQETLMPLEFTITKIASALAKRGIGSSVPQVLNIVNLSPEFKP